MAFNWRCGPMDKGVDEEIDTVNHTNPFLSPLFLPSRTLLDAIIEKFVSVHLVKYVPYMILKECPELSSQTLSPYIWPMVRCRSTSIVGGAWVADSVCPETRYGDFLLHAHCPRNNQHTGTFTK